MPNTPNLFQLSGRHLHISYATSGIDGKPHFTYQDPHQTLSFRGDDIRAVACDLGTLVSVSLRRTVDSGSTSFTVLVPRVVLDDSNSAPIRTHGITTIHRVSIVPAFDRGQDDHYTTIALHGSARAVMF